MPVVLYVIFYFSEYRDRTAMFAIACAVTAATMFALGATSVSAPGEGASYPQHVID